MGKPDLKCPLPWVHLATRNNGSSRLCCHSDTGKHLLNLSKTPTMRLDQLPFLDILNSDHWQDVRSKMEQGIWPEDCRKCEMDEKLHGSSKRTHEKSLWPKGVYTQPVVRELDLRFGNLCNLACVTCSTGLSTRWNSLYSKMKADITNPKLLGYLKHMNEDPQFQIDSSWCKPNSPFWQHLEKSAATIEKIYFSGGEPLLQEEHDRCLKLLIESGRASEIGLRYSTNGTYISQKHIENWLQFKEVNLSFSIDSFGAKNDYIRFGSEWEKVIANLRAIQPHKNIFVSITKSIQFYNALYITDFLEVMKTKVGLGNVPIHFNFVHFPSFLSIQAMPQEMKEAVKSKILAVDKTNGYEKELNSVVKYMQDKDQSEMWPYLMDYTKSLDKVRGTHFLEVFPEYKPFLNPSGSFRNELGNL